MIPRSNLTARKMRKHARRKNAIVAAATKSSKRVDAEASEHESARRRMVSMLASAADVSEVERFSLSEMVVADAEGSGEGTWVARNMW